jgi:hypothetical protein
MQQILQKIGLGLPALVLSFNVLALAPVYAQDGVSGGTETTTSGRKTTTETEVATTSAGGTTETELHDQQQTKIDTLRKAQKTQLKDSERQHRCEGRKVGIENRFGNIVTKSQKIQDKITGFYDKGTAFATANNLTPTNYAALVAAADAAKATSAADIVALKAATPTIDCTNKNIATDIATFKASAEKVKTDLNAYRTAVHAVLASIRTAAEAAKPADTEGSN